MAKNGEYAKLVHLQSVGKISDKVDEDKEVILNGTESEIVQKEKTEIEESIFKFPSFHFKYFNPFTFLFFFFCSRKKQSRRSCNSMVFIKKDIF